MSRWMRVCVLLIVALVGGAAITAGDARPAQAAAAPPPPVTPSPYLPSQVKALFSSAGGIGDDIMKPLFFIMQETKRITEEMARTGKPYTQIKPNIPLTAPTVGWGAKIATGANAAGFGWLAIGGAGASVSLIGNVVGVDFDSSMCHAEPWLQTGYSILTMGMGPSCKTEMYEPNADQPVTQRVDTGLGGFWQVGKWICGPAISSLDWDYGPDNPYHSMHFVTNQDPDAGFASKKSAATGVPRVCGLGESTDMVGGGSLATNEVFTGMFNSSTGETYSARSVQDDPERTLICESGYPGGTSSHRIATFTQSSGFPMGSLGPGCAMTITYDDGTGVGFPDVLPQRIDIVQENPDGSRTTLAENMVPDFGPDQRVGLTPGDNTGLVLWQVKNNQKLSCMTWDADCSGWWEATEQGTKTETPDHTRYICEFGGRVVDLLECALYAPTFDVPSRTPMIDPNPLRTMPGEAPEAPLEWQTPAPGTDPGNTTNPGLGIEPGAECMNEWSDVANPLEWVFHPVRCALVWAFVPRKAVMQNTMTVAMTKWDQTMPGQIPGIVRTAFAVPDIQGCEGLNVDIPLKQFHSGWVDVHWNVLNACDGAGATAAQWSRAISSAILIFFTALGVVRRASAVVNAPGLGSGDPA